MGKRLFLLLFGLVLGVILSPKFLAATDSFVVGQPEFHAVETKEIIKEPEAQAVTQPLIASTTENEVEPLAPAPAPQMINYRVSVFSGEMVAHNLSYSDIYKTGRLVYGHNTANLLGNLGSLGLGGTFLVTEGGVATTYRVENVALYQKTADGFLDGKKNLMGQIMRTALGYDVALMTCAGQSYGNGDASHRLVVFANKV